MDTRKVLTYDRRGFFISDDSALDLAKKGYNTIKEEFSGEGLRRKTRLAGLTAAAYAALC